MGGKEVTLWCTIVHIFASTFKRQTKKMLQGVRSYSILDVELHIAGEDACAEVDRQFLPSHFVLHFSMSITQERGQTGEDAACQYLLRQGYRILGRNVRFGKLELDSVAYDPKEDMIVFIEVKMRTHHSDAYPIRSAMTAQKQSKLRRAMHAWIFEKKYDGPSRLDLISVHGTKVVEHLKAIGSEMGTCEVICY
jgi:putative endonuclease